MTKPDAISMLKADHKKVRGLLAKLSSTTGRAAKTRHELLLQIERELKTHMALEEEIFYPSFKDASHKKEDSKLYYEAKEEHAAASHVLSDLMRADPAGNAFSGKAKVLRELVEHHIKEEETELFKHVKQVLSKEQLMEMAELMQQRKAEIQKGRGWMRRRAA
jgi:hemerythrin superfamily protein